MIEVTDLTGVFLSPSQVEAEQETARILTGAAERVVTRWVFDKGVTGRARAELFDMIFGGE